MLLRVLLLASLATSVLALPMYVPETGSDFYITTYPGAEEGMPELPLPEPPQPFEVMGVGGFGGYGGYGLGGFGGYGLFGAGGGKKGGGAPLLAIPIGGGGKGGFGGFGGHHGGFGGFGGKHGGVGAFALVTPVTVPAPTLSFNTKAAAQMMQSPASSKVRYSQPIVTYAQPIVQPLMDQAPVLKTEKLTAQPIMQPTFQQAPLQRVQAITATAPTIQKGFGTGLGLHQTVGLSSAHLGQFGMGLGAQQQLQQEQFGQQEQQFGAPQQQFAGLEQQFGLGHMQQQRMW